MTYKLKLITTIEPKKTVLQKWAESPIGWWKVTTEGDVEGRSTKQFGQFYGHVVEIAMSIPEPACYSYRFEPVKGLHVPPAHETRQAVRLVANIQLDPISYKGDEEEIAKWLACDEVVVKPCNYYGAYTIKLKV